MFKVIIRRLLLWSNIILALILLLSTYLPYLNPGKYWMAGFAGLLFPLLFPVCLLFIPVWLWYQKKYAFISLTVACLCLGAAKHTWGIHFFQNNNIPKQHGSGEFTLMTYNTSSMGLAYYRNDTTKLTAIYDVIKAASPDILCLQEFYTNDKQEYTNNIDSIRLVGSYPYHYFTCDKTHWDTWHYGIVLFSRFPIINAISIPCGKSAMGSGSSFLQADIMMQKDTIRIFSVQLTSYMFNGKDYSDIHTAKGTRLINKMKQTFSRRSLQALQLAGLVAQSPYPVIVCGDFNDTPVSFTYRTISRDLQDAFLQTGTGFGRTLSYLSPTLRIDYLLPQHKFRIHTSKVLSVSPSEHFPVIACLSLKKD
ncbi:endonuclease/exonuclease/phosphatase family metal-dependent hydrolase [Chitinophaga niastensis]|uniref:Endonuclease/exonuclease/phosphatase family metal-dependent hydrolase n=1 Tax=Chitinophaga niastensis TaxID=536980 RepID=A0A2P8HSH6_CHINA|nr:endonuclease/exonuclease/phosphatase family protein [Chitinophaga niastensis]PSL49189.1 endonuclease/exonuclease/phosphatase family metal-dependent hydrolase [Chitinophaga niastensis]